MQVKNIAAAIVAMIITTVPVDPQVNSVELQSTNTKEFMMLDYNEDFELRINRKNTRFWKDTDNNLYMEYWISWKTTMTGKMKMLLELKEVGISADQIAKMEYCAAGIRFNLNTLEEVRFCTMIADSNQNISGILTTNYTSQYPNTMLDWKKWRTHEVLKYIYGQLACGAELNKQGILEPVV